MRRLLLLVLCALALVSAAPAAASPSVQYGIQDDAWLQYGPGTLEQRLATLDRLGVDLVRYTLRWDQVARSRPADGRDAADTAYDWSAPDAILRGLRAHHIAALVTLYGTPGWANGGGGPNVAPANGSAFAAFASAAARRYSWVRLWTIWNEPNQRIFLRPTSAGVYVSRLLNPAYAAIHEVSPASRVGGGVTSPRGGRTGVAPTTWIAQMRSAHARLDAYAQNPYALTPAQTPLGRACPRCPSFTLPDVPRLVRTVHAAFGARVRVWLTEYGYQTNPPDPLLGVSYAKQALYVAQAAYATWRAPGVDLLVHYLVQDEPSIGRWQSGLLTLGGTPKPSYAAFALPLMEVRRAGATAVLWGQVRPGTGPQAYRLERRSGGAWRTIAAGLTSPRGYLLRTVRVPRGAVVRLRAVADDATGASLSVG